MTTELPTQHLDTEDLRRLRDEARATAQYLAAFSAIDPTYRKAHAIWTEHIANIADALNDLHETATPPTN